MIKKKIWKIKPVNGEMGRSLSKDLKLHPFLALLLNSRGFTDKESAQRFLHPDLISDLHNPFLFRDMAKAVGRIRAALDKKEKILIYGDRDADGVSSSAMLMRALKKLKADASVRVPLAKDGYGIHGEIIEQCHKDGCTLIITVDNGISEFEAMKKAADLGIDVIITDHHTPQDRLPEAYAVINPKCDDRYPFKDLAGVGVAYKLLFALFFSYNKYFDREVVVLDLETTGFNPDDEIIEIGAVKMKNFVPVSEFHRYVKPRRPISPEVEQLTGITEEKLFKEEGIEAVIGGFYGFIKDALLVGHNIKGFDILFIQREVKKHLGIKMKNEMVDTLELARAHLSIRHHNLKAVADFFRIPVRGPLHNAMNDALVTAEIFKKFFRITRKQKEILEFFSEFAVLGSIADIVPLLDENRLIVKKGLEKLEKTDIPGLELLLKRLNISPKGITSRTLSWKVIPIINAAGRMGLADRSLRLLLAESKREAEPIVDELLELNRQRKEKQQLNFEKVMAILEQKVDVEKDKIFIIDITDMEHGVTGVIANRIMDIYYRPVVILILKDGEGIGTARSIEQFRIYEAFSQCRDLFIDFGGHKYAVGFSLKEENFEPFKKRLKAIAEQSIRDEDLVPVLEIDAEIEPGEFTLELVRDMEHLLQPYGEENREPLLLLKQAEVVNIQTIGQNKKHLKLRLCCGGVFFNALYWGAAVQGAGFLPGDRFDIAFRPEINSWNGEESVSLIIEDMKGEHDEKN